MAPHDIGAVVDPRLVVYGTNNVRVVDVSVIPATASFWPVSAIVEKVAFVVGFLKKRRS
jgi:choline dehydrogenase-like flavoprotein